MIKLVLYIERSDDVGYIGRFDNLVYTYVRNTERFDNLAYSDRFDNMWNTGSPFV